MATVARVGTEAPDFSLPGTMGSFESRTTCHLGSLRGQAVVLVFYPGDDTPVCTVQLNSYTADFPAFEAVGARIVALSPQSLESHERFSDKHGGFAFPLLADTDKEVGRLYGVVGPLGFYRRSAFVIDSAGIIRWANRTVTGLTFPSSADLAAAVGSTT